MSHLDQLRAMCEEAERYPLYTNYGNDMQYLVPGNPVRVPVKDLLALLDVAEAVPEYDPLAILENGVDADPQSLDWWDAEHGDLCRAISDSAVGLRAALSALESEENA